MKIAFFTEMGFTGKVPRSHNNMRTEFAWMVALNADHYNIQQIPEERYDLGIVIIPKKNPVFNLKDIKTKCKKVGVMQEGPRWFFQDYPLVNQVKYYNTIKSADIIFCHNTTDKAYFQGITQHPDVRVLPSLMIHDKIKYLPKPERSGVMIGGNFVSWYGGFDSFIIASEIDEPIFSPRMGQRQQGEEQLGITQLPYMEWVDWIKKLNKFKYGVHLMKTHAAGTFALNCAYLGIPCIGYEGLDTQDNCHPLLTVRLGDTLSARKLIRKLKEDESFYDHCSKQARQNYLEYYTEEQFLKKFNATI